MNQVTTLRIDKWLWAARFYKTRQLASDAVNGGHVHLNGQRCKPAKLVKISDDIKITKGQWVLEVQITGITERRGSAAQAQQLYQEYEHSKAQREITRLQRQIDKLANPRPTKKPDKRQRRQLKAWRTGDL